MAVIRNASAHWEGSLMEGAGKVTFESSELGSHDVTWAARANESNGLTSPEELIAAAHSTCYSMALSHGLAQAGTPPETIDTKAAVSFVPGTGITGVALTVTGKVPGLTKEQFEQAAQAAKEGCPVSQALKVPITLEVNFTD
ncbi:OsmC family peroxiredoxin [Humibacillus xanthopallidus]|uniref:Osmotically inducible protein OsmC n=1 Tax=Humibacillus xanthopallidus TaxID=412689 RepID=A0A543I0S1_9MICO|nr:OsmC family peroxiredoxin [Humibacillus xanthopallidus]TQM64194.1 osmotically inducible protein OsmC [Humibacillus xanthopallidus]